MRVFSTLAVNLKAAFKEGGYSGTNFEVLA